MIDMLCNSKFMLGKSTQIHAVLQNKVDIAAIASFYDTEKDRYRIVVAKHEGSDFAFMISNNNAFHPNRVSASYDIVVEIRRQLPYMLVDKLTIDVCSDPFHLKTKVKFKAGDKEWICDLEPQREGNIIIACKIPETFLARLCVEV